MMKTVACTLLFFAIACNAQLDVGGKQDLMGTNMHHIGNLNELPRQCIVDFLKDLDLHETYIRLEQAIKGGHSVIYRFVEGKDPLLVKSLATKHKLKVETTPQCGACQNCCGRILLPGGDVVEADAVPSTRQERGGEDRKSSAAKRAAPKLQPEDMGSAKTKQQLEDEKRIKLGGGRLRDSQKHWYYLTGLAMSSKLNSKASLFFKKLVNDLNEQAPNTVLHLYDPIPNGHSMSYRIVEGDKAAFDRLVGHCGLQVNGNVISYPEKEHEPHAAQIGNGGTNGHLQVAYTEKDEGGVPKRVNVVSHKIRNVVKKLKDKWIQDSPCSSGGQNCG